METSDNFDSTLYKPIIIAIDGTSASGKGTIVKGLQKELDARYRTLDAGSMYRALTYHYVQKGIGPDKLSDKKDLMRILQEEVILELMDNGNLNLNGKTLTDNEIRGPDIDPFVGKYSELDDVKRYIVDFQKQTVYEKDNFGWILDGRCMGSAVAPQAQVKFFLDANIYVRATRRHGDYVKAGKMGFSTEEIKIDLEKRDELDKNTKIAPLVKPQDAIEIDTYKYSPEAVVNKSLTHVTRKIQEEGKL